MIAFSSQCLAIAIADKNGSLRKVERQGRFGQFVAIEDEIGIIEVADNMAEADRRIAEVKRRAS